MEFLYPEWKQKALTFSYDDGQIYDRRLIEIFDKHGLKGTFHLNAENIGKNRIVTREEIRELYGKHEIACHGAEHRHALQLCTEQRMKEIWNDRISLEQISGRIIKGYSYAFGEISDEIIQTARASGILYSRTVKSSNNFSLPQDFMKWNPTMHHTEGVIKKLESFLDLPGHEKMPLLYIWGHSYEFEREQNWELMEEFAKLAEGHSDIWYAANREICEYVNAVRNVQMSADLSMIYNPSAVTIYYTESGVPFKCCPGEQKRVNQKNRRKE